MSTRKSRVPTTRLGRLVRLGFTAGELAVGGAAEGVKRLVRAAPDEAVNVFLTASNAQKLARRLAGMRGAAMKMGQILSMESVDILLGVGLPVAILGGMQWASAGTATGWERIAALALPEHPGEIGSPQPEAQREHDERKNERQENFDDHGWKNGVGCGGQIRSNPALPWPAGSMLISSCVTLSKPLPT